MCLCRNTAEKVRRSINRRRSVRFVRCLLTVMLPVPRPDVDVASRWSVQAAGAAAAAAARSRTDIGAPRCSDIRPAVSHSAPTFSSGISLSSLHCWLEVVGNFSPELEIAHCLLVKSLL